MGEKGRERKSTGWEGMREIWRRENVGSERKKERDKKIEKEEKRDIRCNERERGRQKVKWEKREEKKK